MIIKGQARGRFRQLVAHLLRTDENERVTLVACRGTVAQDVTGALVEMEALSQGIISQRPLYHASISPEAATPLTERQVQISADRLEQRLGLSGQPRLIVLHAKAGREHVHVVWSRIDAFRGKAIEDSWNYRQHEATARELEAVFGHRRVPDSGSWSRRGHRTPEDYEYRQAGRSKRPISATEVELTAIWDTTTRPDALCARLKASGYMLARGDRRVFVVIDRHGEVHSLTRRIRGATAQDIRSRLRGIDMGALPSVAEARAHHAVKGKTSMATDYRSAALEVSMPISRLRAARELPGHLPAIVQFRPAIVRAINVARSTYRPAAPMRSEHGFLGLVADHRGLRALILAAHQAKLALARRLHGRRDIHAVIAALNVERHAALEGLFRDQAVPTGTRRRWRRRGKLLRRTKPRS